MNNVIRYLRDVFVELVKCSALLFFVLSVATGVAQGSIPVTAKDIEAFDVVGPYLLIFIAVGFLVCILLSCILKYRESKVTQSGPELRPIGDAADK